MAELSCNLLPTLSTCGREFLLFFRSFSQLTATVRYTQCPHLVWRFPRLEDSCNLLVYPCRWTSFKTSNADSQCHSSPKHKRQLHLGFYHHPLDKPYEQIPIKLIDRLGQCGEFRQVVPKLSAP